MQEKLAATRDFLYNYVQKPDILCYSLNMIEALLLLQMNGQGL